VNEYPQQIPLGFLFFFAQDFSKSLISIRR